MNEETLIFPSYYIYDDGERFSLKHSLPYWTKKELEKADNMEKRGKFREAYRIYQNVGKFGYPQIGFLYLRGYGVVRDHGLAMKYYKLTLECLKDYKDEVYSCLVNLGVLSTMEGDYEGALRWQFRALKNKPGDGNVTNNIGYIYLMKGDVGKAVEYYEKASELGECYSKYSLASIYENGVSNKLKKNPELSQFWYRKLFKEADSRILYNFGKNFQYGFDCFKVDLKKSRLFFQKAFEKGIIKANKKIREVSLMISDSQRVRNLVRIKRRNVWVDTLIICVNEKE